MNRLACYTGLGLLLISLSLNLAFADRTDVKWYELDLKTREVTIQLENSGSKNWDGLTLTVRVYGKEEKPVANAFLHLKKPIAVDEKQTLKLALDRQLLQGRNYRVLAFLQQGSAKVQYQNWNDVPAFELWPNRKNQTVQKLEVIPEPKMIKKAVGMADIRSAMGIF